MQWDKKGHTDTPIAVLGTRCYSQRTVMLAVALCWPMSLTDRQRYCPASDGIRLLIVSCNLPGAASDTWRPFS